MRGRYVYEGIAVLTTVTVMFWNVENFFSPSAEHPMSRAQYQQKCNGIAKTILCAADEYGDLPALVGLAEVESRWVVHRLVNDTPLGETGLYGYVHRESPDARGIDVALLYRKDVFRVVYVDSLRIDAFQTRDILYVKGLLTAGGVAPDTLHIFVNHWPSQLGGSRATAERRAAARHLLEHAVDSICQVATDAQILAMGDFNTPDPAIDTILLKSPPEALKTANPDSYSYEPPGTIKYHGRWEKIDHFFISDTLLRRGAIQTIFAPPHLLEPDKAYLGLKPRRTHIGPRYNSGLSDHLPIILQIKK